MRRMVFAAAAAAVALPAAGASTEARKGRWIVDWGEERCSLIRESGGEADPRLMLRTVPGTSHAELWLLGADQEGLPPVGSTAVDIRLKPGGARLMRNAVGVSFGGSRGLAVTDVDAGFVDQLAGAGEIAVSRNGRTLVAMPVPDANRAVESLRACEKEVMRDFGVDPAAAKQPARPAEDPRKWVRSTDFPAEIVRDMPDGTVLARLDVGANGRVRDCSLIEGTGNDVADRRACELLTRHGRFEPAVGADGKRMRGVAAVRVRWTTGV